MSDQGCSIPGVVQQGAVTPGNAVKWWANGTVIDGGVFDTVSFNQLTTGFSQTIPDGVRFYIIGNNTLLATGSITMPANPQDSQRVTISSRSGITLLSVSANTGQTLFGTLASLAGGGFATWIYRSADTSWYRIG